MHRVLSSRILARLSVLGAMGLTVLLGGCSRREAPPLAVAPFDAGTAAKHQQAWADYLGSPPEITNSIGMRLKLIPPGEFLMGAPAYELERWRDEWTNDVRITKPFYLGVHEVTQGEYQSVMGTHQSRFSDDGSGDTSRRPVENVCWEETEAFCGRLSALTAERSAGRVYRLPTEAEWEYACRAGTTTPFHFGSQFDGSEANCDGHHPYGTETEGPRLNQTTTIGSYPPNAFGLHDMHGNVCEFCLDWYDEFYPRDSVVDDPPGPPSGTSRVVRGGHWASQGKHSRSACRSKTSPTAPSPRNGFRVVLAARDQH